MYTAALHALAAGDLSPEALRRPADWSMHVLHTRKGYYTLPRPNEPAIAWMMKHTELSIPLAHCETDMVGTSWNEAMHPVGVDFALRTALRCRHHGPQGHGWHT